MRDRLIRLLEKADLALGSAAGVVDEAALVPLIQSVKAVRARLGYPEDVLVVALAGGTGSGKSSLFNAICGEELVDTGGMRPTTSNPAAAVPESVSGVMDGYLDLLGIAERHPHSGPSQLCLIDLPDTDSVEIEHRHRVDGLLSRLDVVVWVTDPEKYRDARLHDEYLRPLAGHGEQFSFVMNQIDRLSPAEAEAVCHDLGEALAADGLGEVDVIPVASAPPSGPPIGIDRLVAALAARDRSTLHAKLLDDVAETCQTLHREAGVSLDFDARAAVAVGSAAEALIDEDRQLAIATLTGFLDDIDSEVGGPVGDRVAALAAEVPGHVRRIADTAVMKPPVPRRRFLSKVEPEPVDLRPIETLITEAVIRPVRALLARRAVAVAALAELAIEIEEVRATR